LITCVDVINSQGHVMLNKIFFLYNLSELRTSQEYFKASL